MDGHALCDAAAEFRQCLRVGFTNTRLGNGKSGGNVGKRHRLEVVKRQNLAAFKWQLGKVTDELRAKVVLLLRSGRRVARKQCADFLGCWRRRFRVHVEWAGRLLAWISCSIAAFSGCP